MSVVENNEILLRQYSLSIDRLNFESEQQVVRNNFYMIFQGVVFVGFMGGYKPESDVVLFISVCAVMSAVSFLQCRLAAANVVNIEICIRSVKALEAKVLKESGNEAYSVYSHGHPVFVLNERRRVISENNSSIKRRLGLFENWFCSKSQGIAINGLRAGFFCLIFWVGMSIYMLSKIFNVKLVPDLCWIMV